MHVGRGARRAAAAGLVGLLLAVAGCRRAPVSARGDNLVLVTIDTLRADHVGCYGAASAVTPNLDRLAREGVRFAAADSPVPLTLPAHASILTGQLPPHHGLRINGTGRLPEGAATLATRLKAAGYRTGAFVAAFVLDRRFGLGQGFDRYDDEIPRDTQAGLEAERPGKIVVDRALAFLAEDRTKPFFLWVHLYEPHAPYAPPEPFASRFAGRPYDGEVATADDLVGRLLADLESSGAAGRTVVALAGDHGESLGEHGELTHGLLLYEPALHVPLVVRAPGALPAGSTVKTPVSLVDLAPTLAALLELPAPAAAPAAGDGRDLSAALRDGREPGAGEQYAETQYPASFGWSPIQALRSGGTKYIAAPRPELYDLDADPGEAANLVARREGDAAELAAKVAAVVPATVAPTGGADAETRARLASLGYLAGAALPAAGSGPLRDPKDAVALFRRFEESHAALVGGRFAEARSGFEQLLVEDPTNSVFTGQLAEICRRTGDLSRAIELYRTSVERAPSDADARYNLAVTLEDVGRHDEAFAALSAAIRLDPGRPEAHNALGIALAARGELPAAREELSRAVALDPHSARAYNNLGNVERDLKQLDAAEAAYRRAAELAPSYADPVNGLGAVLVQRGRFTEAVACFDRVLALDPGLHEARLNKGIAAQLGGDRAAAATAYRDFLARSAGDPQFAPQRQVAEQLLARLGGS
jgi:arylsulfatase A-like enzyme/Flp pilus assembly protein TadD